jgi:hypothetical protein
MRRRSHAQQLGCRRYSTRRLRLHAESKQFTAKCALREGEETAEEQVSCCRFHTCSLGCSVRSIRVRPHCSSHECAANIALVSRAEGESTEQAGIHSFRRKEASKEKGWGHETSQSRARQKKNHFQQCPIQIVQYNQIAQQWDLAAPLRFMALCAPRTRRLAGTAARWAVVLHCSECSVLC